MRVICLMPPWRAARPATARRPRYEPRRVGGGRAAGAAARPATADRGRDRLGVAVAVSAGGRKFAARPGGGAQRVHRAIATADAALRPPGPDDRPVRRRFAQWAAAATGFDEAIAASALADWLHYHAARPLLATDGGGQGAHRRGAGRFDRRLDAQLPATSSAPAPAGRRWRSCTRPTSMPIRTASACPGRFRGRGAREPAGRGAGPLPAHRDRKDRWAAGRRRHGAHRRAGPEAGAARRHQLIERGMMLYDGMRNPKSAADLRRRSGRPASPPSRLLRDACHLADSWFKGATGRWPIAVRQGPTCAARPPASTCRSSRPTRPGAPS